MFNVAPCKKCVSNYHNMCLITFLIITQEKVDIWETKVNETKTRKVHVDVNEHCLWKNGDCMSSNLGGKSISVGKQWVSEWDKKTSRFNNFNSVNLKG